MAEVTAATKATKQAILDSLDLSLVQVPTPEWASGDEHGYVTIQELDADRGEEFEVFCADQKAKKTHKGTRTKLCSMSIIDDNGDRMFSDEEMALLAKKSYKVILRISDAAFELNGLGQKAGDDLEGKSEKGQGDGSVSG